MHHKVYHIDIAFAFLVNQDLQPKIIYVKHTCSCITSL